MHSAHTKKRQIAIPFPRSEVIILLCVRLKYEWFWTGGINRLQREVVFVGENFIFRKSNEIIHFTIRLWIEFIAFHFICGTDLCMHKCGLDIWYYNIAYKWLLVEWSVTTGQLNQFVYPHFNWNYWGNQLRRVISFISRTQFRIIMELSRNKNSPKLQLQ